ncbi:MAG: hypothetical protein ACQERD_00960 [Campylobacterota bacterium]
MALFDSDNDRCSAYWGYPELYNKCIEDAANEDIMWDNISDNTSNSDSTVFDDRLTIPGKNLKYNSFKLVYDYRDGVSFDPNFYNKYYYDNEKILGEFISSEVSNYVWNDTETRDVAYYYYEYGIVSAYKYFRLDTRVLNTDIHFEEIYKDSLNHGFQVYINSKKQTKCCIEHMCNPQDYIYVGK